jgi:hypothetical protein
MKHPVIALTVVLLGLVVMGTVPADAARTVQAQTMETCPMTPTIQALRDCVQHAVDQGLIDNAGVATSLFAKLDAAQAAQDRGQPTVAVQMLQAFIDAVGAQAGQHIDAAHAAHMIMHAQLVIAALTP